MAKSKWENIKDKLLLVEGWARNGLTDEQISNNLGIAVSTLNEYKKKYPEFSESLKRGKEVIDLEVENALLKRALGYRYIETTKELNTEGHLVITKEVTKEVAPDTTAQIFWLKNRKPQSYKDKRIMDNGIDLEVENKRLQNEKLKMKINKMKG